MSTTPSWIDPTWLDSARKQHLLSDAQTQTIQTGTFYHLLTWHLLFIIIATNICIPFSNGEKKSQDWVQGIISPKRAHNLNGRPTSKRPLEEALHWGGEEQLRSPTHTQNRREPPFGKVASAHFAQSAALPLAQRMPATSPATYFTFLMRGRTKKHNLGRERKASDQGRGTPNLFRDPQSGSCALPKPPALAGRTHAGKGYRALTGHWCCARACSPLCRACPLRVAAERGGKRALLAVGTTNSGGTASERGPPRIQPNAGWSPA